MATKYRSLVIESIIKLSYSYDDTAITFIATKADDISCSEVIRALKLEDDEDIEVVEEKINVIKDEQKKWKNNKAAADRAVKGWYPKLMGWVATHCVQFSH
jgi:hypothetical protein